ncbi:uncharacterized protein OCT59_005842 [Rhizophagus irregularis]|uniref:Uncharacterized protein n=1 Tax=Rhizophagus irregularis TaxID=588596 RepID=A0A915Z6G3_9GLOM|nr:hypothetical protein OCT59_005842 [Rhizophagus irregularis]GBC38050.2 hypothetical protein RIR_jg4421.t1 [Rhizophagus irregularis DAOM 181602=DAOM 197198]CAB4479536.1 unnamed protein product [Rhizophagus irregularis]CAB5185785.1 unnamed protein product [Rhizophagus irregularis]CAB5364648.1 unnamed protein product [Rhizophagus irregularis]
MPLTFFIWLLYQCYLFSNIQKRNSSLLIIEWGDEDILLQRNIQRTTVIAFIREFPGYSQLVQNQSDSIFYFIDTPSTQASCIVDNIVLALKRKYHQVNMVSFGRVYISKEENLFRANEILNVF